MVHRQACRLHLQEQLPVMHDNSTTSAGGSLEIGSVCAVAGSVAVRRPTEYRRQSRA